MGSKIWCVGRVLMLLMFIPHIYGWGSEGHVATCRIAEGYLTEAAASGVQKLLPAIAEGNFSSVCPWPDTQRSRYPWSGALHYLNTPDFWCNYTYCRDCHDSTQHRDVCVTGAIYNYTMQLKNGLEDADLRNVSNLTEALMFLAHFIGDIHQPLHVGFIGDAGGNGVHLHWYELETNLHRVWDTLIIESAIKTYYHGDFTTMIQSIQSNLTNGTYDDILCWDMCDDIVCPELFADEGIKLACQYAYRNATPGSILGDEYFNSRLPIVEKRLAQGGIRLAALLNRIFNPSMPSCDQKLPACSRMQPLMW